MVLPKSYAAPIDLTDAEFARLDELFCTSPVERDIADAVMLDGYLCGLLVQPRIVPVEEWLPRATRPADDEDDESSDEAAPGEPASAHSEPVMTDAAWLAEVTPLITRRHAALTRSVVDDGTFDPFILEPEEDQPQDEADDPEADDIFAGLGPVSQALAPWVMGFQLACVHYEALFDTEDEAAMLALARLFRHLPRADKEMAELVETMERERPLETLDEGVDELVACTVELFDLTSTERFHVETVKRAGPKVGRNDACPCGSGKKFKVCHGAPKSSI